MSINRNQLMAIILIFALLGNTAIHFFHPAYRRYDEVCRTFESRMTDFERSLQERFIPIVSNVVAFATFEREHGGDSPYSPLSPSVVTTALSSVSAKGGDAPAVFGRGIPDSVILSYGSLDGTPFVLVNNSLPLFVGQSLFGERIMAIDETCTRCENSTFFYAPALAATKTEGEK